MSGRARTFAVCYYRSDNIETIHEMYMRGKNLLQFTRYQFVKLADAGHKLLVEQHTIY